MNVVNRLLRVVQKLFYLTLENEFHLTLRNVGHVNLVVNKRLIRNKYSDIMYSYEMR